MVGVPEFAGKPDICSCDIALTNTLANLRLIAVDGCTINAG